MIPLEEPIRGQNDGLEFDGEQRRSPKPSRTGCIRAGFVIISAGST